MITSPKQTAGLANAKENMSVRLERLTARDVVQCEVFGAGDQRHVE